MGRVAVLGSLNVDVVTLVERHPLPGETLLGEPGGTFAGGKGGNQAAAAARVGADVAMLARVGDDGPGRAYLDRLAGLGVDTSAVSTSGDAPTGTAFITVDEQGENSIIVVAGANGERDRSLVAQAGRLGPGDVLLCSLEVHLDTVADAARAAHSAGARVVLNLAPYAGLPSDVIALADPVVVNESEMRALADSDLVPQSLLVTFGAAGARWGTDGVDGIPVAPHELGDTVGAGDAFCGALAAALAGGADRQAAVEAANAAGAAAVRWVGAQPDATL
ncbi:PfkB family carbohydrate kinase [Terrabacter sp. Root181]|uniref:PfkB family carbohydrate kinase n=1 Tax=Terrabacter sp. Root181 TaxID=1736484 RepID=UPI0006F9378C|nr:PfkB family carbohydrate kinase [Terrabacter sp. Root181]KRB43321.1 ribokinase [Terrabacter sp. Root181]